MKLQFFLFISNDVSDILNQRQFWLPYFALSSVDITLKSMTLMRMRIR